MLTLKKLFVAGGTFLALIVLTNGQDNSLSKFPTPGPMPTIAPIGTPAPLPTLAPFPTPAALPSMPPAASPSPGQSQKSQPSASPTPLPDGSMPLPLPVMPTPIPLMNSQPVASPSPAGRATPMPDGSMPLPLPPMPTPIPLPDAQTLSEELNLPTPAQTSEPLAPGQETGRLKDSESMAMKQKMAQADFLKSLDKLIAQQRNPAVADMTLEDAERIALKQNPTILNAAQQIRFTQGQVVTVRAQAIPQLNLASSYNQQGMNLANNGRGGGTITIPNPNGKPIVIQSGGGETQNKTWNIQLTASQLIYDGGAVISGIRSAIAGENSAFFSLRASIDSIIAQVKTNFFQVVLNRALIVAQEQSVTLLQQQLKDQQNRYEAGTVPRFNVLQAEVALANAKPPLIQAQNAYRISLYTLVKLLGMDYPRGHPSEVPFNIVGQLAYNPRKIDTDQSIRVAVARNPSLKAQRQLILSQAANVNAQFAGYLPTISATAGHEFTNNLSSMNLSDSLDDWFFGATGSWAIWDGLATAGKVQQAKAQLQQASINYDNSVRQIILDVQQAISNLQQAKETIDSQEASVVQGMEALRLAQERLDAGAGTQLDVLNAQVSLLQSQTFVLQARYDYISALAQYDQALSLDTQYQDSFADPLTPSQAKKFSKLNEPGKPQPPLPRALRAGDPIKPILDPNAKPEKPSKKSPKPTPTPKAKPTPKPKTS
ncbi:MAG: TolC family protein [Verrucomicrobia bacterium]|nr:TolC family protein [Verrucomicrobiota bacterium]